MAAELVDLRPLRAIGRPVHNATSSNRTGEEGRSLLPTLPIRPVRRRYSARGEVRGGGRAAALILALAAVVLLLALISSTAPGTGGGQQPVPGPAPAPLTSAAESSRS